MGGLMEGFEDEGGGLGDAACAEGDDDLVGAGFGDEGGYGGGD